MNKKLPNRKSIRLQGYDYTQAGLYFVTICTQNREHLFGKINDRQLILNEPGKMIEKEWLKLTDRFKNIRLHQYVVMPNHFHAILEILGATLVVDPNDGITPNDNGQPEGIAPTNGITPNDNGQPQGITPMETVRATLVVDPNDGITPSKTENGQPQGIAPTENGIAPTNGIPPTLGEMVGAFKSITMVEYIRGVKTNNWKRFDSKLWQRNYWEHIIRNEIAHQRIAQYIIDNPYKWEKTN